jgi:hypothetical protein
MAMISSARTKVKPTMRGDIYQTHKKIGAISLIFQKSDPLSLDNYRPITLLNTDVSIFNISFLIRVNYGW